MSKNITKKLLTNLGWEGRIIFMNKLVYVVGRVMTKDIFKRMYCKKID